MKELIEQAQKEAARLFGSHYEQARKTIADIIAKDKNLSDKVAKLQETFNVKSSEATALTVSKETNLSTKTAVSQ